MSNRTLQRPKLLQNELTRAFDGIDRWKLAERFDIDRIHDKTRADVFRIVAAGRPCADFQDIAADLAAVDGRPQTGGIAVVNWADFTNDIPEGKHVDFGPLQPLADTHRWLREVIARHCPFTQPALNHGRIWMTVARRRETLGLRLMGVLRRSQDVFRELSREDDRNKLLNALMILVPEIENSGHGPLDYLGAIRQDFGMDETDHDFTLGSFVPSQPRSAIADPHRAAPPALVFRHKISRNVSAHTSSIVHRHLIQPELDEQA